MQTRMIPCIPCIKVLLQLKKLNRSCGTNDYKEKPKEEISKKMPQEIKPFLSF